MAEDVEAEAVVEQAPPEPQPEAPSASTQDSDVAKDAAAADDGLDWVEAAVRQWVADHLRNSILSRFTPAWNYLSNEAVPHLITAIKEASRHV